MTGQGSKAMVSHSKEAYSLLHVLSASGNSCAMHLWWLLTEFAWALLSSPGLHTLWCGDGRLSTVLSVSSQCCWLASASVGMSYPPSLFSVPSMRHILVLPFRVHRVLPQSTCMKSSSTLWPCRSHTLGGRCRQPFSVTHSTQV